jgi:hypothetical protein
MFNEDFPIFLSSFSISGLIDSNIKLAYASNLFSQAVSIFFSGIILHCSSNGRGVGFDG